MQTKLIFTTKVLRLASFRKWEFLKLGNDIFSVKLLEELPGVARPLKRVLINYNFELVTFKSLIFHEC